MRRMVTTCDAPGCGRDFVHEPLEVRCVVGKGRVNTRDTEHHACSTACASRLLASFGAEDSATLIEARATQHEGQTAQALYELAKDFRSGKHIGSSTFVPSYPGAYTERVEAIRAQIELASGISFDSLSVDERQMVAMVTESAGLIDVDTMPCDAVEMLAPAIVSAARLLTRRAVERLDRAAMRAVWDPVKSSEQDASAQPHPFDLTGQYERMLSNPACSGIRNDAAAYTEARATQEVEAAQVLWDLARDMRRGKHIGCDAPPAPCTVDERMRCDGST